MPGQRYKWSTTVGALSPFMVGRVIIFWLFSSQNAGSNQFARKIQTDQSIQNN